MRNPYITCLLHHSVATMAVRNLGPSLFRVFLLIVGLHYISGDRELKSERYGLPSSFQNGDSLTTTAQGLSSYRTGVYPSSGSGEASAHRFDRTICQHMVASFNNETILASCTHGLFRSLDHGQSWNLLSSLRADALFLSPRSRICLLMRGGDLFTSDDIGSTWNNLFSFPTNNSYSLAASDEGRVIAVASDIDGLYLSTDRGVSWTTQLRGLGFAGDQHFSSIRCVLRFHSI